MSLCECDDSLIVCNPVKNIVNYLGIYITKTTTTKNCTVEELIYFLDFKKTCSMSDHGKIQKI